MFGIIPSISESLVSLIFGQIWGLPDGVLPNLSKLFKYIDYILFVPECWPKLYDNLRTPKYQLSKVNMLWKLFSSKLHNTFKHMSQNNDKLNIIMIFVG